MTFGFWLRLLLALIFRFGLLLGIGLFYENFEVSPLPAWTLTLFVYLLLFLTTYLFTRWVFGKRVPTKEGWVAIFITFLLLQTIAEVVLYIQITNASLVFVMRGYGVGSLLLLGLHTAAIIVAGLRTRKQVLRSVLPEGLSL